MLKALKKYLKCVKSIKNILELLESVQKSPSSENPLHAETSQSTRNASKVTGCNKTKTQNQRKFQNIQRRPKKTLWPTRHVLKFPLVFYGNITIYYLIYPYLHCSKPDVNLTKMKKEVNALSSYSPLPSL